jgi:hypothetical protein
MQYILYDLLYILFICDKSVPQWKQDLHLQDDKITPSGGYVVINDVGRHQKRTGGSL